VSDVFVPLASFLRPALPEPPAAALEPSPPCVTLPAECEEAIRAARRFRAGLADALDAALPPVLDAIARDVLARELRLEGADVAALVEAALDHFGGDVVRVCVHPHDFDALAHLELERLADGMLDPGDIRIELRSGTIDLSLQARLDAALRAWS
jgi:flagellar biosynthesis/type III secretory pathway protein FliH